MEQDTLKEESGCSQRRGNTAFFVSSVSWGWRGGSGEFRPALPLPENLCLTAGLRLVLKPPLGYLGLYKGHNVLFHRGPVLVGVTCGVLGPVLLSPEKEEKP